MRDSTIFLLKATSFARASLVRLLGLQPVKRLPKTIVAPELFRPTYADRHRCQTFLVFGTGPSLKLRSDKIFELIERYRAITIGPNTIAEFIHPDYHVFTSRHRLLDYGHTIDASRSRLLIGPYIPLHHIRHVYGGEFEYVMYCNDNEADLTSWTVLFKRAAGRWQSFQLASRWSWARVGSW